MTQRPPIESILVVIPTYNEKENIETIVGRLRKAVPAAHVLIADDNSPDGTGEIADRMAEGDDQVHVMHRPGKQGLGAAYLAGFEWGLQRDYDAIVEMDADGSHQPEQLPRLLDALAHADMVKGSRYVKGGSTVNWPLLRKVISRGGSLWSATVLGLPLRDVTGGFNAFRADTLRKIGLDEIASAGYCFQIDLAWRTHKAGLKVVEVPIEFVEREFGTSKMNKAIVAEAMIRTTLWGVDHRAKQLQGLVKGAPEKARTVNEKVQPLVQQAKAKAEPVVQQAKDAAAHAKDAAAKRGQQQADSQTEVTVDAVEDETK